LVTFRVKFPTNKRVDSGVLLRDRLRFRSRERDLRRGEADLDRLFAGDAERERGERERDLLRERLSDFEREREEALRERERERERELERERERDFVRERERERERERDLDREREGDRELQQKQLFGQVNSIFYIKCLSIISMFHLFKSFENNFALSLKRRRLIKMIFCC
jgi:hypothetical protein